MAAIDLPFAASGDRRIPSAGELSTGFPCGPADQDLFNWIVWWLTGQADAVMGAAGLATDDTDLHGLTRAIRGGQLTYFVDQSVTANTVTITPSVAHTAYFDGLPFSVKLANDITGAATLNVNGIGAGSLVLPGGGALARGDFKAGDVLPVIRMGTAFVVLCLINQSIIDTAVTKTVHGTSPDFADLVAAFAWLSRRRIGSTGSVTLSVRAGQFSYGTSQVNLFHPDMSRISIVGAAMLGATPVVTDFTTTGNTSGQRSADLSTNLALLRARFATELQFTVGGGLVVSGGINLLDKILVTGSAHTGHLIYQTNGFSNYGIVGVAGAGLNGIWIASSRVNVNNGAIFAIGCGTHGIFCQAGGHILAPYQVISCGNAGDGVQVRTGSTFDTGTGTAASSFKGNAGTGLRVYDSSASRLPTGCIASQNGGAGLSAGQASSIYARNITAASNTTVGVFAFSSSEVDVQSSSISGNTTWGVSADQTSSIDCRSCAFSANTSGAATASFSSSVLITSATGTTGAVSPPVNTAGNGNAYIYQ